MNFKGQSNESFAIRILTGAAGDFPGFLLFCIAEPMHKPGFERDGFDASGPDVYAFYCGRY